MLLVFLINFAEFQRCIPPKHMLNKKKLKKNFYRLFSLSELSLITLHWFLTAFASVVDIRILLRIWDLLFYESSVVLFQVTLGMLKIKVAHVFGCFALLYEKKLKHILFTKPSYVKQGNHECL